MNRRIHTGLCVVLLGLGLLQSVGLIVGSRTLRGIGAATVSSPLPFVFSEVRGVETFASDFVLEFVRSDGQAGRMPITPREYSRLRGAYNWRNVYGAAISYGPVLPAPLWESVLNHGFCGNGPLAIALDVGTIELATVQIVTRTAGRSDAWRLEVECSP